MLKVVKSISQNTGFAPWCSTTFAVETQVKLGIIISPLILLLIGFLIFDAGIPKEIPGAFFVSVAPCGLSALAFCAAYNVSPENIIKAIFISTFASIGTIFFAIQYLTL